MAKIVTFGELLLRLNTPQHQRFTQMKHLEATFAGAEANVAVACAQFGHEAVFISALPPNAVADAALRQLGSWGVRTDGVLRTGSRMGVYFLEEGFGARPASVIYDREGSSFSTTAPEGYDWPRAFEGASWLHLTGITPALSPALREELATVARAARAHGVKVSVDLNYRSKLWSMEEARPVMEQLARECDLLLGSVHQVGPLLGIPIGAKARDDALAASGEIRQRHGVETVVLTSRETLQVGSERRWAVAASPGGGVASVALEYRILDPLGGGDAFSGGLLSALVEGKGLKEALDFGVACAAWKYSHHGDFLQASRAEVESLLGQGVGGGVLR